MAPPAAGTAAAQLQNLAKLPLPAKIGIGALLVTLTGLVYWVVFYNDVSSKIETAHSQQAKLRSDLVQQQGFQATFFADRDELALRQQRQREFNKVLPPDTEAAAFLSSVQLVSNTAGISLNAWQPMEEEPQAFYAKVPMRLEITGRFHQIVKFSYEVGKIDRIINLENIQLSEPKIVGADVILKARCMATAFHAPKPAGGKK